MTLPMSLNYNYPITAFGSIVKLLISKVQFDDYKANCRYWALGRTTRELWVLSDGPQTVEQVKGNALYTLFICTGDTNIIAGNY